MGDYLHIPGSSKRIEVPRNSSSKKTSNGSLVASIPKIISLRPLQRIGPLKPFIKGIPSGQVVVFVLKVAVLEVVRRFSRARCPFVWQCLQALQVFSYPPFKWIERWAPFKYLIKGMQNLSKPLLLLSITTAISDGNEHHTGTSNDESLSPPSLELPANQSTPDLRVSDEAPEYVTTENVDSDNWLLNLKNQLKRQGLDLPERINEDELRRFYKAANGDFSCLLTSLKKTIRWRETYTILSSEELEMWSNLVFWHGYERPCLVIRLGLSCSSLAPVDRPRFAQAIVSQIEYGVLHLVNIDDPQITVLLDCEGLSPFRFPMQMLRSCSALVQDHYPNRLGTLFIIRLPSVVRVIAQTFIQVLKPTTRKKLRIEGESYKEVLSEFLQMVPSFLGGQCTCEKCRFLNNMKGLIVKSPTEGLHEVSSDTDSDEVPHTDDITDDLILSSNCDQVLRAAVLGVLVFLVLIAFIAGMYDVEGPSMLP
ncbi:hypothetical protein QJS10_CPB14g01507 [Acorus calamus]|uniref:CRAL-TRIO domain-containing protein n=1 Tax=Acorus calamus TaxID=4465 RepID=A0AAV9DDG8_ACOCL|nr:hypothetical protein QJS10_CPB14g01507 [Acorus calamus]